MLHIVQITLENAAHNNVFVHCSFFAGTYSNITSTVNNWAYALSESGEELNGALQLFVESTGATEYVTSSLIPSDPIGIVFILAILVGLIGGMWTSPAPKE